MQGTLNSLADSTRPSQVREGQWAATDCSTSLNIVAFGSLYAEAGAGYGDPL